MVVRPVATVAVAGRRPCGRSTIGLQGSWRRSQGRPSRPQEEQRQGPAAGPEAEANGRMPQQALGAGPPLRADAALDGQPPITMTDPLPAASWSPPKRDEVPDDEVADVGHGMGGGVHATTGPVGGRGDTGGWRMDWMAASVWAANDGRAAARSRRGGHPGPPR